MGERVRLIGPKVCKSQFLNGLRPFIQFFWDTTASLLSFQSIHEEDFRFLSNFIVTCSTWMSISVTADPSSRPVHQTGRSAPFEEMPSSGWSVRNEPIAIAHIPSRREQFPETLARVGRFCCKISMLGQCGWSLTIQCEKQARAPPKRKGGARCKGYLTQANHSIRLDDRAKEMAREKTGIATDRMLIAATHTHSAPAAMGALGCPGRPGLCCTLARSNCRGNSACGCQSRSRAGLAGQRSTMTV